MKPRLEVAPLTPEDKTIWNRLADRNPLGTEWCNSTSQDRRDADLMLYAQQHRLVCWVGPPMIHVRNAVSAYWADPPWQGTL